MNTKRRKRRLKAGKSRTLQVAITQKGCMNFPLSGMFIYSKQAEQTALVSTLNELAF